MTNETEKTYCNFFLMPSKSRKIHRVRLTRRELRFLTVAVVLFSVFAFCNVIGFWYYRSLYSSLQRERRSVVAYEQENSHLIAKVEVLEAAVGETERMAGHLASLVGTERLQMQRGVGGSSPVETFDVRQKTQSVEKFAEWTSMEKLLSPSKLDRLSDRVEILQAKIKDLSKVQEDKLIYITSTPSIWPVKGWVTSDFGIRRSPLRFGRDFHEGIDIASQWGTPVMATADGVVTYANYKGGLGRSVIIDHGFGVISYYGHNSKLLVGVGQKVQRGTKIALVGSTGHSTGPHCHYEIHVDGVPVDPMKYIVQ